MCDEGRKELSLPGLAPCGKKAQELGWTVGKTGTQFRLHLLMTQGWTSSPLGTALGQNELNTMEATLNLAERSLPLSHILHPFPDITQFCKVHDSIHHDILLRIGGTLWTKLQEPCNSSEAGKGQDCCHFTYSPVSGFIINSYMP